MNHNFIFQKIIEVYKQYAVRSFPIDCVALIEAAGYRVLSYGTLLEKNSELYELCLECSEDAYREPKTKIVAYNQEMPSGRIRFSLAHELGHIILEHPSNADYYEQEANYFAAHLLAPQMAIHYARCKNESDVASNFDLSEEAARYAFDDYRRWHRNIVSHGKKMSPLDREMYHHFYDEKHKAFIWRRGQCYLCGRSMVNGQWCRFCEASRLRAAMTYEWVLPEADSDYI